MAKHTIDRQSTQNMLHGRLGTWLGDPPNTITSEGQQSKTTNPGHKYNTPDSHPQKGSEKNRPAMTMLEIEMVTPRITGRNGMELVEDHLEHSQKKIHVTTHKISSNFGLKFIEKGFLRLQQTAPPWWSHPVTAHHYGWSSVEHNTMELDVVESLTKLGNLTPLSQPDHASLCSIPPLTIL